MEIWLKLMKIGARLGCHQRPDRSFFYKGYQFPVCARCTGLFVGYFVGIAIFMLCHISYMQAIILCMHNSEYEFKAGRVAGKSAINEFFKMMQINYVVDVRKAAKKGDVTKWFIRRKKDGLVG